jgi:hypothetical protein
VSNILKTLITALRQYWLAMHTLALHVYARLHDSAHGLHRDYMKRLMKGYARPRSLTPRSCQTEKKGAGNVICTGHGRHSVLCHVVLVHSSQHPCLRLCVHACILTHGSVCAQIQDESACGGASGTRGRGTAAGRACTGCQCARSARSTGAMGSQGPDRTEE